MGAPNSFDAIGHVCFYERNANKNWEPKRKLTGPWNQWSYFGASVAIHDKYVLVGAPGDENEDQAGAAYIFERLDDGAFAESKALVPQENGKLGTGFGSSVAIDGNWALVGSPDAGHKDKGHVSFYKRKKNGNWVFKQKIAPGNAKRDDRVGVSVAIHDDYALLGSDLGAAWIYKRNANGVWKQKQKIAYMTPPPERRTGSGASMVDLRYEYAILGGGRRAAFLYKRRADGVYVKKETIRVPTDTLDPWDFGMAVSISKNNLLVGGLRRSAFVYELDR